VCSNWSPAAKFSVCNQPDSATTHLPVWTSKLCDAAIIVSWDINVCENKVSVCINTCIPSSRHIQLCRASKIHYSSVPPSFLSIYVPEYDRLQQWGVPSVGVRECRRRGTGGRIEHASARATGQVRRGSDVGPDAKRWKGFRAI
jgi:hypothetical protein